MWTTVISLLIQGATKLKGSLNIILGVGLALAVILALWYRSSLISLEEKIASSEVIQEIKVQYITEYIDREKIVYKDRVKYIKEFKYDENKTECENALNLIRSTNL
jgi:hypothetical protein